MEVNKPDTVKPIDGSSAGVARKHPEEQRKHGAAGEDAGAGRDRGARRSIDDKVSIMGIPAAMLTPEVNKAIDTLMEEIEHLRQALEWTRGQQARLQGLADGDGLLPVLNRRAFVRELGKMLARSAEPASPASLICLHLANGAAIRRRRGRPALDQALTQVCRVLAGELHPADVVGSLGGDDFGVILGVDRPAAAARGAALADAVRGQPFRWQDKDIGLDVVWAVRALESGAEAEAVLAATDQDLLAHGHESDAGAGQTGN